MDLDFNRIRSLLPERRIHHFATIGTTMEEAARLAAAGAPSGTVILADEQTAGRGRMGRTWHSEPGSGLYLTVILRPTRAVPLMTLAVGISLRQAIEEELGGRCAVDLRWPNDVLINDRKCAGILLTNDGEHVLAGIGVNVNHTGFPDDIADLATSLRMADNMEHSREDLLVRLLHQMDAKLKLEPNDILRQFAEVSSYVSGRHVEIEGTSLRGTTAGLDEEGFLLLRLDDGRIERVVAGGVRPLA